MTMIRKVRPMARKDDPRSASPSWCPVYARKTPILPWHNGLVGEPCIGCRVIIPR